MTVQRRGVVLNFMGTQDSKRSSPGGKPAGQNDVKSLLSQARDDPPPLPETARFPPGSFRIRSRGIRTLRHPLP
jgi:hypothetical protein